VKYVLYFHISTLRIVCAVPNIAVSLQFLNSVLHYYYFYTRLQTAQSSAFITFNSICLVKRRKQIDMQPQKQLVSCTEALLVAILLFLSSNTIAYV